MTNAHLEKTLRYYLRQWRGHYPSEAMDTEEFFPVEDRARAMRHAMWMCEMSLEFVTKGEVDKAHRWLGFVQAALWACGHYTIDEMRVHSTERTEP